MQNQNNISTKNKSIVKNNTKYIYGKFFYTKKLVRAVIEL